MSRNGLFEIKIAENGKEAVDYFHAVNQFDFVIMDMEMPVVDDFEVYVFIFSGFFTSTPWNSWLIIFYLEIENNCIFDYMNMD